MSASASVTAINGSSKLIPAEPSVSRSAVDKHVARLVTRGLRANTALNLAVRVLLGLFGVVSCALALRYIAVRGDEMVEILSKSTDSGDRVGKRLLVLCMPVLLFGLLAGLAAAAAWTMHARGQDETTRTLDMLSRLKREGEVAVSARGLMYAFEEKLQNARRALNLLLWLGRTLFLICIGLFAALDQLARRPAGGRHEPHVIAVGVRDARAVGRQARVRVLPVRHRLAAGRQPPRDGAVLEVEQPQVGGVAAVLDEHRPAADDVNRARARRARDRLQAPVRRRLAVFARLRAHALVLVPADPDRLSQTRPPRCL
jgi:hypothetical protein